MDYEASAGGILLPVNGLTLGGVFHGQHIRDGVVIDEWEEHNLVVDQGLNHILNVTFNAITQVGTWYLGIFEGNYTPVAADTAATFAASATESTAYAESVRQTYNEATSTAKSLTNSASKATFTINATKNIYGAFLISDATKSGTTGTLMSAAKFGAAKAVIATDQLLLSYTFTAASV